MVCRECRNVCFCLSVCASPLFRGALLAFGLHGFTHILFAVIAGRYTTGVATSPIIVIPYWIYARSALRKEGLRDNDPQAFAIAVLVLPVLVLVHVVSWFLTK
ncbi:MAG: HXXEE domain-containing protein [Corynebacterium sp.]|nr:HXXEE domain-containing protein [Corynebacterium sp.]MDO5077924.1 HXXEE domain-containing protein [Corynebacterium sp.]